MKKEKSAIFIATGYPSCSLAGHEMDRHTTKGVFVSVYPIVCSSRASEREIERHKKCKCLTRQKKRTQKMDRESPATILDGFNIGCGARDGLLAYERYNTKEESIPDNGTKPIPSLLFPCTGSRERGGRRERKGERASTRMTSIWCLIVVRVGE